MKPIGLLRAGMASLLTLGISTSVIYYDKIIKREELVFVNQLYDPVIYEEELVSSGLTDDKPIYDDSRSEDSTLKQEDEKEIIPERVIVYDDMTMEELTDKLNRTLSSDLSGKGEYFAEYSIELGVDPYLAVAIAMHETGCAWNCSYLAKQCNNVGGQKGEGCGEYKAYDTLEDGIYGFILNIKNKYVDYGLMTADEMNPKYAEDPTWSSKVNNYIEKIKNN